MVFPYSKQLFLYVIIWLIGGSTMNAYLKIDSYTATEKLITSYILQHRYTIGGNNEDSSCTSKFTSIKK